jgi:uncharacterized protein
MTMNRKDWTLLAICAGGRKGLSPVQLQKTLFLLGRELPNVVGDHWYDFKPYHYGPFDRAVYDEADNLAKQRAIAVIQREGENWNCFEPTPEGVSRASFLEREAPTVAVKYIDRLVEWVQAQSFQKLITAVYGKYPEMRVNSVFRS